MDTVAGLLPTLTLLLPPPPHADSIKVDKIRIGYFKYLTSQREKKLANALLEIASSVNHTYLEHEHVF